MLSGPCRSDSYQPLGFYKTDGCGSGFCTSSDVRRYLRLPRRPSSETCRSTCTEYRSFVSTVDLTSTRVVSQPQQVGPLSVSGVLSSRDAVQNGSSHCGVDHQETRQASSSGRRAEREVCHYTKRDCDSHRPVFISSRAYPIRTSSCPPPAVGTSRRLVADNTVLASLAGWGAHLLPTFETVHGVWTLDGRAFHIYVLEMLAAFRALIFWRERLRGGRSCCFRTTPQ